MASWMDKFTGRKTSSANAAKERLQLVLIHDRTDLTPGTLDAMKDELLVVISRYVEIDPREVQITMAQDGREQRLVADIPLKAMAARKRGG
ncbi:MAG: cell division topological specificity factor MinE [Anaerolineaceae bacterium]